jgi:hypothetical protein
MVAVGGQGVEGVEECILEERCAQCVSVRQHGADDGLSMSAQAATAPRSLALPSVRAQADGGRALYALAGRRRTGAGLCMHLQGRVHAPLSVVPGQDQDPADAEG